MFVLHVSVEGIIAAGKTTLIELIREEIAEKTDGKIAVLPINEPVDEWKRMGLLQAFYEDQNRYAFVLQSYSFQTRITKLLKAVYDIVDAFGNDASSSTDTSNKNIIYAFDRRKKRFSHDSFSNFSRSLGSEPKRQRMEVKEVTVLNSIEKDKGADKELQIIDTPGVNSTEHENKSVGEKKPSVLVVLSDRSILLDHFAFGHMLGDEGKMNALEFNIYEHWWKSFSNFLDPIVFPDCQIFLKTSVTTAMDRMYKRGVESEKKGVSADYQSRLLDYHEKYFNNTTVDYFTVDGDIEFLEGEKKKKILDECSHYIIAKIPSIYQD